MLSSAAAARPRLFQCVDQLLTGTGPVLVPRVAVWAVVVVSVILLVLLVSFAIAPWHGSPLVRHEATTTVVVPDAPPPVALSAADIRRLDEPWEWFQSSNEHRDLLDRIVRMRVELGRPLLILDIGLNIGSAPWAIARVCPDCEVYGFEPIPKYFAYAAYRLPPRDYPNIHLFNYAVCDHVATGEHIWMETAANVGWNTLIAAERTATQVQVPIVCVTVDIMRESGLLPRTIDLIKIDTEGAEHLVLRGMKRTIQTHSTPKPLLYIEVGWGRTRADWAQELDAFQMLFDNGYRAYDMDQITGTSMHWITPQ